MKTVWMSYVGYAELWVTQIDVTRVACDREQGYSNTWSYFDSLFGAARPKTALDQKNPFNSQTENDSHKQFIFCLGDWYNLLVDTPRRTLAPITHFQQWVEYKFGDQYAILQFKLRVFDLVFTTVGLIPRRPGFLFYLFFSGRKWTGNTDQKVKFNNHIEGGRFRVPGLHWLLHQTISHTKSYHDLDRPLGLNLLV